MQSPFYIMLNIQTGIQIKLNKNNENKNRQKIHIIIKQN